MATINDVMRLASAALDTDADVQGYCSTTWSKACLIYEVVDTANPPELVNAPMVHLVPDNRDRIDQYDCEYLLLVGVFADPGAQVQASGTNIIRWEGHAQMDALAQLVEHCISNALQDADYPIELIPADPDKLWGDFGAGVFYAYRVVMRDPL